MTQTIDQRAREMLAKHCDERSAAAIVLGATVIIETTEAISALTEALTRIEELEGALTDIMNGRGVCTTCGTLATGEGGGYTDCECVRPTWGERDPAEVARAALTKGIKE